MYLKVLEYGIYQGKYHDKCADTYTDSCADMYLPTYVEPKFSAEPTIVQSKQTIPVDSIDRQLHGFRSTSKYQNISLHILQSINYFSADNLLNLL